jgi:hypothetical protein
MSQNSATKRTRSKARRGGAARAAKRGRSNPRRKAAKRGTTATPAERRRPPRRAAKVTRGKPTTRRARAGEPRRWSAKVTATSDALDLEPSVFKRGAKAIAISLKRSAEQSKRRKAPPFRAAMSMLTFYENRAGRNLSPRQKQTLERAKQELRKLYHRA